MKTRKVAILVDGGFFIKRYRSLYPDRRGNSPSVVVRDMYAGLLRDLRKVNATGKGRKRIREIYRIFFYDCPPLTKRLQNPVSRRGVNFGDTPAARFRTGLHEELKTMRKMAVRLGRVADMGNWVMYPKTTKALLGGTAKIADLTERDVHYEVRQKGVDMRIGLDIATLAYQHLVDQIILVAGDSDFVPAAKLARREGIDFVLDPMWNPINPDLHEHIDGLVSCWQKPQSLAVSSRGRCSFGKFG